MSQTPGPEAVRWKGCRLLLRYAAAGRRGWAFILAIMLLSSAFHLLQPWPVKIVLDHVLGQEPMSPFFASAAQTLPGGGSPRGLLVWAVLASLAIFAVTSMVDVVLTRAWIRVGQRMVYELAGDLFAAVQRRSLIFHSRNPVGDSLSRIMGDSWCVYKVVDTLLFTPGYALIIMAGMAVLMAQLDVGLTLLALAVAPFMTASTFLLGARMRKAARANREIESRMQSHVQRTLSGIQVVQAFTQEEREQSGFHELTEEALRIQRRSTLVRAVAGLASGLIITAGTGAILWTGAHHVLAGQLTVGSLLVFLAYLTALQAQLKTFTGIYSTLQESGASMDRVLEVLETEAEVRDRPGAIALPSVRGHVRFEDVTFGYQPGQPVLHGVSLEVQPGQTLAVVGFTGAGKTTLVSLVARFFDPWHGRVLLDGHDLCGVQLHGLRQQVGLVLQEPFLFPWSVADNIAYGRPEATRAEIEAAAQAANAHAFILRLPQGYDSVIGERGATLSGGERQRLSIARAFLKDAPVLILDEPTSALDAETEGLLLEALRRLMAGRTTLIIAHRLSTIRHADRIVVLDEGRIVETGTHQELLARGGVYARLHQLQYGPAQQAACGTGSPL